MRFNTALLGSLITTMGVGFVSGYYYHSNPYILILPIAITLTMLLVSE